VTAGPPFWTDDRLWADASPPAPSRQFRRAVKIVMGVAAVLIATSGIAAVVGLIGLSRLGHVPSRHHFEPIPIASAACPYVMVMHVAATNFQNAFPGVTTNMSALDASRWRTTRRASASTASVFEQAIVVSIPHFPAPVRAQLATTARKIHEGRKQLVHARDPNELVARTLVMYATGQRAFGYASDLVGDRCGVHLAADTPPLS
jgi:hypothetical protein